MQQKVHMCGELAARDEETLIVALDGIANMLTTAEKSNMFDKVATLVE